MKGIFTNECFVLEQFVVGQKRLEASVGVHAILAHKLHGHIIPEIDYPFTGLGAKNKLASGLTCVHPL